MDLKSPYLIYFKGILFLFMGLTCLVMLILLDPEPLPIFLLLVCIWSFCRAYYFAFYVIEKYVDSSYKFSGLWSFVLYLAKRKLGGRV